MKRTLTIQGMNCEGCARTIENIVKLQGHNIKVDFDKKSGESDAKDEKELQAIIDEINKSGFHATLAK